MVPTSTTSDDDRKLRENWLRDHPQYNNAEKEKMLSGLAANKASLMRERGFTEEEWLGYVIRGIEEDKSKFDVQLNLFDKQHLQLDAETPENERGSKEYQDKESAINSKKRPYAMRSDTCAVALQEVQRLVSGEKARAGKSNDKEMLHLAVASGLLGLVFVGAGIIGYTNLKGSRAQPEAAQATIEEVQGLRKTISRNHYLISDLESKLSSANAAMAASAYDPTVDYDVQYDYGSDASRFYVNTAARKTGKVVDLNEEENKYNLARAGARINFYNRLKKLGLTDRLTEQEKKGFLECSGVDISIYGKNFGVKNDKRKLVVGKNGELVPEGNYDPEIRRDDNISPAQLKELRKYYR